MKFTVFLRRLRKQPEMDQGLWGLLAVHQPHLLDHLDSLDRVARSRLTAQLSRFNYACLNAAFRQAMDPHIPASEDIEPVHAERHVVREQQSSQEMERLEAIALRAIAEGRVGVAVLAGGQGSRLGSDRPKGVLPLDTGLGCSAADSLLFIRAAQIAHLQRMAVEHFPSKLGKAPTITWLLMTSKSTDAETRAHLSTVLRETGLHWDQVLVFVQNEIPAFDCEGRVLLASAEQLATAPDGNGGFYEAISPVLPELEKRGVGYLHIVGVDNILCRVADPHMIGCAIDRRADCTLKVIEKSDPTQKVGTVCLEQGRIRVLEYSEIPRELAERRDPNDPCRLFLRAGSITSHLVTVQFLEEACSRADSLPYHAALKRIPHWDWAKGRAAVPREPNGVKLERFIFDAFGCAK